MKTFTAVTALLCLLVASLETASAKDLLRFEKRDGLLAANTEIPSRGARNLIDSLGSPTIRSCRSDEIEVEIALRTDTFGFETGIFLTNSDGNVFLVIGTNSLATKTEYAGRLCVPRTGCYTFSITDT